MEVLAGQRGKAERPGPDAGEAMRSRARRCGNGRSVGRSEPWKHDRDAAADGFAGCKQRTRCKKQHRLLAGRLPGSEVSALQVKFGSAGRGANAKARHARMRFIEGKEVGKAELDGQLFSGLHGDECTATERAGVAVLRARAFQR